MTEIDLTLGREQDVEVELLGERSPHAQRRLVQRNVLGGVVVGPDDLRVPSTGPAADVSLLEHGDVRDPVLGREVVRERQSVDATAYHHHVVTGGDVGMFEVDALA